MENDKGAGERHQFIKKHEINVYKVHDLSGRRYRKGGKSVDVKFDPTYDEQEWDRVVMKALQTII